MYTFISYLYKYILIFSDLEPSVKVIDMHIFVLLLNHTTGSEVSTCLCQWIYMDRSYRAPLLLISIKKGSMIRIKGDRQVKRTNILLYICVYLCMYVFIYISLFIIHISYTYISFCIFVCIHLVCIYVFILLPSSHISSHTQLIHNSILDPLLRFWFYTHTFCIYLYVYVHIYIIPI